MTRKEAMDVPLVAPLTDRLDYVAAVRILPDGYHIHFRPTQYIGDAWALVDELVRQGWVFELHRVDRTTMARLSKGETTVEHIDNDDCITIVRACLLSTCDS